MRRGRYLIAIVATVVPVWWLRADPPQPWVVEPAPEAAGAVKSGEADVKRAQALGKQKDYAGAVTLSEDIARTWPAAVHDCNLSLAYLRAGALTKAQLMWDVAGLRNSARPNWCTGDLSTQLSTALRAAGYVPVTIDVSPHDAVVETYGVRIRNIPVLWLPAGPATIAAHAPGRVDLTKQIDIAPPNARVTLELVEPKVEPVVVDAGVIAPPVDAAPVAVHDAAPIPPPIESPAPRSKVPLVLGSIAAAGFAGGATFYFLARGARDDANAVFATDPAFADAKDRFSRDRVISYSLLGIGVLATGYLGYWIATDHGAKKTRVGVTPTHGGAALTIGGSL